RLGTHREASSGCYTAMALYPLTAAGRQLAQREAAELWRFWQRCGFTLVRLGTHREASSGCYTAMALYPLTAAGRQLAQREA
ncbi:hypothetical protein CQA86_32340, partial [Klebsiella pneumoniae]